MTDKIEWATPTASGGKIDWDKAHAVIDGIGHVQFIDGWWVADDGKRYSIDFAQERIAAHAK